MIALRGTKSFQFYFLGAAGIHLFAALLFSYSFSSPALPVKTGFVFLGSFLSAQDVGFFTPHQYVSDSDVSVKDIKLDSKNTSDFRQLNKPSLTYRISAQQKNQFKPVQSIEALKSPSSVPDNFDADFEMAPPVKLRIGQ